MGPTSSRTHTRPAAAESPISAGLRWHVRANRSACLNRVGVMMRRWVPFENVRPFWPTSPDTEVVRTRHVARSLSARHPTVGSRVTRPQRRLPTAGETQRGISPQRASACPCHSKNSYATNSCNARMIGENQKVATDAGVGRSSPRGRLCGRARRAVLVVLAQNSKRNGNLGF
jgi:hypothetical protein